MIPVCASLSCLEESRECQDSRCPAEQALNMGLTSAGEHGREKSQRGKSGGHSRQVCCHGVCWLHPLPSLLHSLNLLPHCRGNLAEQPSLTSSPPKTESINMYGRSSTNATHLVQPLHGAPAHNLIHPHGLGDPHQFLWGRQDWIHHQGWLEVCGGGERRIQEELRVERLG